MNALQVKMEMERLVPAKMSWEVEEIEKNTFETVFPSKGEMSCMIEWGGASNKRSQSKVGHRGIWRGQQCKASHEKGLGADD
jgi:hypothetical protein